VVELRGEDGRKLSVVLRARSGDAVEICDSGGQSFLGRLRVEGVLVAVELVESRSRAAEPRVHLTLAQAVPKGAKMDFVVEKATELGVARIVPLSTERSIGEAGRAKVERWRRLARTAAMQSGRAVVPEVAGPATIDEITGTLTPKTALLIPWELAERRPLRERLPSLIDRREHVVVVIGPEGGLSHDEVERLRASGGEAISLGARILRTETAGLIALGAILYSLGEL
jgi:16S rRNA (uracil1498-N3)-methyltransferase